MTLEPHFETLCANYICQVCSSLEDFPYDTFNRNLKYVCEEDVQDRPGSF